LEVGIYDAQMAKIMDKAAAELRRLDAENARMRSELERPMSSEATVLVHDNARLRAEVQALRGAVPAGWRLVPVAATPEMLKAIGNKWDGANVAVWQRMLAAAPQPAQGEKQ
jgi:hypothetical protein